MLLRHVTRHLQKQDWTAIGIDFLIVVLGVFVGLQAQEWYGERARRVADSQYVERMHREVVELIAIRENVVTPRSKNFADIAMATSKVFGTDHVTQLTTAECAAIQLSHVFTSPTTSLPTVDELISAGRLDSLSSRALRSAITRYTQSAARANDLVEAVNSGSLILSREYPELIILDAREVGNFGLILGTAKPTCDIEGMRANRGFLNDFADNKNRFDTYYRVTLAEPTQRLKALHAALDQSLGIEHASET